MSRRFRLFSVFLGLLLPASLLAAELTITPELALSSDQYGVLSSYKQFSEGSIAGAGARLSFEYSTSDELNAYIAILDDTGFYNPADLYHFVLPATQGQRVHVKLNALTTWSPGHHVYYINFVSNAETTDAQFGQMLVTPSTFIQTVGAIITHPFSLEPFWVSSAHLLRGYRILSTSLSAILGLILCIGIAVLLIIKRKEALYQLLGILVAAVLLYNLRVSTDLTIHSVKHLHSWMTNYSYGEARDTYGAADSLIADEIENKNVSVCFDSTDYFAKLFRYLVYPVPVTMTSDITENTTHVLVTHALEWNYENGILQCGNINKAATKISEFPDGTVLFSLP